MARWYGVRSAVVLRCIPAGLVTAILLAVPAGAGVITGWKWFPIGPKPLVAFTGPTAGRATTAAVNPLNADDVWLGTAGGGVWHSSDAGVTWLPTSDGQASLAIGAIALGGCSAGGCTQVFAGTGEDAIRRDTYYGQGLLLGTVSGGIIHWSLSNGQPDGYDFSLGSINNVVLDRTTSGSGQVLYITLSSGVTASASEATVTAPQSKKGGYGIYKSINNGLNWTKLTGPGLPPPGSRPTDLEIDPANHMALYAGFLGLGIFQSTDGGSNWCALDPGNPKPGGCKMVKGLPDVSQTFDRVEIEIAHVGNPPPVYATFGLCKDPFSADCTPSVYVSKTQGADWTLQYSNGGNPVAGNACPSSYTRYTHALTAHPTQAGRLFLGGLNLCVSSNFGQGPWACADTSTLGGTPCSAKAPDILHLDHHAVVFAPSDPNRAYEMGDGGVAVSTDGGTTWTPRNDFQTVEFQAITSSPKTARVIGGTQDNGGLVWLGWNEWYNLACCGDGGFPVMDPSDVHKMYVTSNMMTQGGTFYVQPVRSVDFGVNFEFADNDQGTHVNYNFNLPITDPRAFYPPFIQDATSPVTLYFGTNRLYRSVDDAGHWSAASPVLSTDPQTEILFGQDVITAIAVAPGHHNRIYIGYDSGKVFVTDGACDMPSCWTLRNTGLPAAPITWIAVDPQEPDTAYVTQSGFYSGVHVFRTTNAGAQWNPTGSIADLNGLPANAIAVEPANTSTLWLATDHGVYKSLTAGGSWFRFSDGLPNVPVYSLTIDADRNRVVAATHGRGAYMLSQPTVNTFGGCVNNGISDVAVNGLVFKPNQTCTMTVRLLDGSACAGPSGNDALGGVMATDDQGVLGSSKNSFYNNLRVAWACKNGSCLNKPASDCNVPNNPMSTLVVNCASQVVYATISGCPPWPAPSSSDMTLQQFVGGLFGSGLTGASAACESGGGDSALQACFDPRLAGGGAFDFLPVLQSPDGTTRALCVVTVPFASTDTAATVLLTARDAVNVDPGCQSAGVTASIQPPRLDPEVEDLFTTPGNLTLSTPTLSGSQLIPSMRAAPGQATGACFRLESLGIPALDQIRVMRIRLATSAAGAQGGGVAVRESSGLGDCAINVPTSAGDTASMIAAAIEAAFQAAGIPGPNPGCPSDRNPRDVTRERDSVVLSLASVLEICSNDPGVGVASAPAELCVADADCEDGNPCTRDTCDTASGQCRQAAEPDGLPCEDGNACTFGNACLAGTCGTRVTCDDRNPCTTDACDPATGACVSTPISCDDGNACTADFCNPDSGRCLSTPIAGALCDDGDPCTSGDACVSDPTTGTAACIGTSRCDDGNPCTADRCDPATGQCSSAPIACDDGNPCTFDYCEGGACNAVPVLGSVCDDDDRCTTGDTCMSNAAGQPFCVGQASNCDDGNVCTVDRCDPVTGGCTHTPMSLAEVPGLQFTDNVTLTWQADPAVFFWNTYRGTIPAHLLGSRSYPPYDHGCFERDDSHGDGPQVAIDPAVPLPDTAFYYLVTEVTGCGEGPTGRDSDGSLIPNGSVCLVP